MAGRRWRRLLAWILGIPFGCLTLLYAAWWIADTAGVPLIAYHFDGRKFDRAVWHAKPDQRGPMVVDLIRKHLKPGTPRSLVESLLGAADKLEEPIGASEVRSVDYFLGSWSGFLGIDGDYLKIVYLRGRIVEAYHWQS